MKVLLVHDAHLKYAVGQVGGLVQAGVEMMTLCRAHPFQSGGEALERKTLIEAMRRTEAHVIELPGLLRDRRNLVEMARARRTIIRWKPDVIHVHDQPEPRSVLIAPRRPTVLTVHDPLPHPGHPKTDHAWTQMATDWAERRWRDRADAAIVHSETLRRELASVRTYQQVSIIPHGIDVAAEPAAVPRTPTVAFFGKLQPYKGMEVLEAAMPLVWASRPEVRFVVAGRGNSVPRLRDPRLTLHHRYIEWDEVQTLLEEASLLVLPYTSASQTGVGSIAVARGIPLVVTDVGALPDLALTTDYVVPPGDPESLAAAILRHLDDGAAVRALVLERVARPRSWESVGLRTAELYRDLLDRFG